MKKILFMLVMSLTCKLIAFGDLGLIQIAEYGNGQLGVMLNDNTQWVVVNDPFRKVYEWCQNDPLMIIKNPNYDSKMGGKFLLKNCVTNESLAIDFDYACLNQIILPAITNIDVNGYLILLNNGMEFEVSWSESWTSWNWNRGEAMLLYPGTKDSWLIINISQKQSIVANTIKWKL